MNVTKVQLIYTYVRGSRIVFLRLGGRIFVFTLTKY